MVFVMSDHLVDDEAKELPGKCGVEVGPLREVFEPGDLGLFAGRIGRRQIMLGLERAHRLGVLEALRRGRRGRSLAGLRRAKTGVWQAYGKVYGKRMAPGRADRCIAS